jgi:hypothetical protein
VQLAPRLGNGTVQVYAGFWRRSDGERLPVSQAGRGTIQPDGRLLVGSFESRRREVALEARAREGEIVIDGNLREPDWRRAAESEPWVHPNDGREVAEARTQVRALWDEEALYLGITATDEDIWATFSNNDENLWEEENLEIFLDPLGDGLNYVELQINPRGAVFDALFERVEGRDPRAEREREFNLEGLEAAVALTPPTALDSRDDRDRRWTAELRIPWASLPDFGPRASSGDRLRVNFYRYERPREGDPLTVAWSPVYGGSFHQPDKFGELVLVGQPTGATEPTPSDAVAPEAAPDEAAPDEAAPGEAAPEEAAPEEGTGGGTGAAASPQPEEQAGPRPDGRVRRVEGRSIQLVQPATLPPQLRTLGTSR